MNDLWDAIVYQIWWPIQIALMASLLAVLFLLAVRLFGWERVRPWVLKLWVPVAILLAAFGLTRRSQQQGYNARRAEEEKAIDKATDDFEEIHRENEGLTDADLDKKNDPWLDRGARS